mmetsp:Transcript_23163/g.61951  ORF Transcript_23163/g.61951 Transcript_23163/m.61951 type:complete len:305 (+) Transcript_23163:1794-2708(+)
MDTVAVVRQLSDDGGKIALAVGLNRGVRGAVIVHVNVLVRVLRLQLVFLCTLLISGTTIVLVRLRTGGIVKLGRALLQFSDDVCVRRPLLVGTIHLGVDATVSSPAHIPAAVVNEGSVGFCLNILLLLIIRLGTGAVNRGSKVQQRHGQFAAVYLSPLPEWTRRSGTTVVALGSIPDHPFYRHAGTPGTLGLVLARGEVDIVDTPGRAKKWTLSMPTILNAHLLLILLATTLDAHALAPVLNALLIWVIAANRAVLAVAVAVVAAVNVHVAAAATAANTSSSSGPAVRVSPSIVLQKSKEMTRC